MGRGGRIRGGENDEESEEKVKRKEGGREHYNVFTIFFSRVKLILALCSGRKAPALR